MGILKNLGNAFFPGLGGVAEKVGERLLGGAPEAPEGMGMSAADAAALGHESLDFQKKVYEEQKTRQTGLDELTKNVVKNYLDTQTKESGRSDEYYNYMMNTFRPVEQSLVGEANSFDTEAKRAELAGKAGADVEQTAAASDEAARRDAARFGINPSDAAFSEGLAGSALNKTIMKVGAMNQARQQARAEGRAFKFDVTNLGRGLPQAAASSTQLATQSNAGAMGAGVVPSANARANAGTVNAGYGTAIGGQGVAGNIYSNLYSGNLRGQQQSFDQMTNLIGSGLALAGISSRKTKHRVGRVADGEVVKAIRTMPVDRWRYKPGAGLAAHKRASEGKATIVPDAAEHVGPYAEDFQKRFGVGDGKTINVIDAIGVTFAAMKGLAKEVDKLKGATS
jgi:hypothetical protein